jgi:hypothetical protein
MHTAVVLTSAERFDNEYPATLPARLQWLEDRLQIERRRILRLMGLPKDQASSLQERPWKEIAPKYELRAERAEHLLTHYLSYFDYDVKKARAFPQEFAEQVKQGRYQLTDYVPALVFATTPVQREDALLAIILEEESRLLPVLASFLAAPERNGRRRKKRPS